MKKITIVLGFALIFLLVFIQTSYSEIAKEGRLDGVVTFAGNHKVTTLDKGRMIMTFESFGVRVSDSNGGLFNNMSTHHRELYISRMD